MARIGPVLVFGLSALASVPAEAAIAIRVTWTYVSFEVAPFRAVHQSRQTIDVHLAGNTVMAQSGREATPQRFGDTINRPLRFGSSYNVSYAIKNQTIVRTVRTFGSVATIRIRTNGHDSCSASIQYSKLPGHPYFEGQRASNGEMMIIAQKAARDISCSIGSV